MLPITGRSSGCITWQSQLQSPARHSMSLSQNVIMRQPCQHLACHDCTLQKMHAGATPAGQCRSSGASSSDVMPACVLQPIEWALAARAWFWESILREGNWCVWTAGGQASKPSGACAMGHCDDHVWFCQCLCSSSASNQGHVQWDSAIIMSAFARICVQPLLSSLDSAQQFVHPRLLYLDSAQQCAGGGESKAALDAAAAQEAHLCPEVVHGREGLHEGGLRERLRAQRSQVPVHSRVLEDSSGGCHRLHVQGAAWARLASLLLVQKMIWIIGCTDSMTLTYDRL